MGCNPHFYQAVLLSALRFHVKFPWEEELPQLKKIKKGVSMEAVGLAHSLKQQMEKRNLHEGN